MYNSGVIKVYPDAQSQATFVEFSPPPLKIAFSWINLEQMVTSEALAQSLARQMVKHYQELFEAQWKEYFVQQHNIGQEGLLIPALSQIWEGQIKHQIGSSSMNLFKAMMMKDDDEAPAGPGSIDAVLAKGIPGFRKMRQPCPVCKNTLDATFLRDTIIHLNDHHKWPREQIAEWLDTLDHDLRFKVPGGGEEDGSDH